MRRRRERRRKVERGRRGRESSFSLEREKERKKQSPPKPTFLLSNSLSLSSLLFFSSFFFYSYLGSAGRTRGPREQPWRSRGPVQSAECEKERERGERVGKRCRLFSVNSRLADPFPLLLPLSPYLLLSPQLNTRSNHHEAHGRAATGPGVGRFDDALDDNGRGVERRRVLFFFVVFVEKKRSRERRSTGRERERESFSLPVSTRAFYSSFFGVLDHVAMSQRATAEEREEKAERKPLPSVKPLLQANLAVWPALPRLRTRPALSILALFRVPSLLACFSPSKTHHHIQIIRSCPRKVKKKKEKT